MCCKSSEAVKLPQHTSLLLHLSYVIQQISNLISSTNLMSIDYLDAIEGRFELSQESTTAALVRDLAHMYHHLHN